MQASFSIIAGCCSCLNGNLSQMSPLNSNQCFPTKDCAPTCRPIKKQCSEMSAAAPENDWLVFVLELADRFAFLGTAKKQFLQVRVKVCQPSVLLGVREIDIRVSTGGHNVELGVKHINALQDKDIHIAPVPRVRICPCVRVTQTQNKQMAMHLAFFSLEFFLSSRLSIMLPKNGFLCTAVSERTMLTKHAVT